MHVWLLYYRTTHWDESESTDLLGVFSTPQRAIGYARRDRVAQHSASSGPIVPDVRASDDNGYVRLNERYSLSRETVDPTNADHVCNTDTCISVIG